MIAVQLALTMSMNSEDASAVYRSAWYRVRESGTKRSQAVKEMIALAKPSESERRRGRIS
jgi:hypothetical protein